MIKNYTILFFVFLSFGIVKAQTTTEILVHDGLDREYILHIPANYDANVACPLILSLHGLGDNIANFSQAGLHQVSDTANFIVVTPQAIEFSYLGFPVGTAWNSGVGAYVDGSSIGFPITDTVFPNENIDDVSFLSALIDAISADFNVDMERVYATGFSMGGFMSNRLAVELNNRIAAIASVSGTLGANVNTANATPIPVLHIHGTTDATISYDGNNPNGDLYTILGDSVPGLLEFWVGNNECDLTPLYNANYATVSGNVVEHYKWENGLDSTVVEHLKVIGADHEWFAPFYPREIWKFFKQHKNKEIDLPSALRGVNELSDLILYPNPSNNVIQLSSASSINSLRVFNAQGQEVLRAENTTLVNIQNLNDGIYFMIVEAKDSIKKLSFVKN